MTVSILKIIAIIAMTLDHIAYYIPEVFPIQLRWIGRLAGPIYVFCFTESIRYTSNRKKLLLRIYIASIITSIINLILIYCVKNDRYLIGNVFPTFFLIGSFVYLWEREYASKIKKVFTIISFYMIQNIVGGIILALFFKNYIYNIDINMTTSKMLAIAGILPNYLTCESGTVWVLMGILLYVFNKSKTKQAIVIIIFSVCMLLLNFLIGFSIENVFYLNYEWMAVFSLIPILLYNGKKGKSHKYFFYIYYSVHMWILYLLGNIL